MRTRSLVGLPAMLGLTYHHVAYRPYVRAQLADGTEEEGLHFVRSDADNAMISLAGKWFSDFRFHAAKIELHDRQEAKLHVQSRDGRGDADLIARPCSSLKLPVESCFSSLEQRESILKYKPEAFSIDASGRTLKMASVHRDENKWTEEPIEVESSRWCFLESLGQRDLVLERATRVAPIDYRWSLGERKRLRLPTVA